MSGLLHELKRRNVFRVGVAYLASAWLILQVLDLVLESTSAPPWVMLIFLTLFGIGFPITLFFAWAYEITPEGVKLEREVDRSKSITHQTGRRLDRVIISVLALAVALLVLDRVMIPDVTEPTITEIVADDREPVPEEEVALTTDRRSIAVLPFVNMSSDNEQEYFADGLTEEILNSLAKTPDLLVTARTSSFSYKGSSQAVPEIASELGVDHILEGSVRRGGETLRITAQLIRAADGFHLWSETFDRTMDDIIAIQEEIAVQIAKALQTAMDPGALEAMMDVGTSSVAAYESYLVGRGLFESSTLTGDPYEILKVHDAFSKSVDEDPEFAKAWFQLYGFWSNQASGSQMAAGITELPIEEVRKRKRDALANAIRYEKDPVSLLEYRAADAWDNYDFHAALRHMTAYLDKRPGNFDVFQSYVTINRELGRHADATRLIRDRYAQYDFTPEFANLALQSLREVEEAELMRTIAQQAIDSFPGNAFVLYQAHRQLLWAGDIDGAALLVPRIRRTDIPESFVYLVELRQACSERRLEDAARRHNAGLEKYDDNSIEWLAYEIMGDQEAAYALFAEIDERGDVDELADYLTYAHFDPRPYPRLMARLEGQGFDDRPVLPLPYRCDRETD